jgi:hypothetical protein
VESPGGITGTGRGEKAGSWKLEAGRKRGFISIHPCLGYAVTINS